MRLVALACEQPLRHGLPRGAFVPLPVGDARRGPVLDPAAQQVGADRRRADHRRPHRAGDLLEQRRRRDDAAEPQAGKQALRQARHEHASGAGSAAPAACAPATGTRRCRPRRRSGGTSRRWRRSDAGGARTSRPTSGSASAACSRARARESSGTPPRARRGEALRRPSRRRAASACICCASMRAPE